jgi:hypothetical protein
MKKLVFLFLTFIIPDLFAQGVLPSNWGLKEFHITNSQLGDIYFYVTEKGIDQKKPLLFVVSGCAGLPVMLVVQYQEKFLQLGTVPPDQIKYFSDQYHVAFIGKAGTPFCDTMSVTEINPMKNLEEYNPSEEYIQKCGMDWEIKASTAVIDTLCKILAISENKIVALGFSEGGRLVTRLAAENNKISHLVCVVSGGLNQFFSSIINRRIDAATGTITHDKAQEAIDSLYSIYKEIYSDPQSTEKWYYGHPYKRWGSFCTDIPLEHLVKLEIPIYYLNGSVDRSTPVLEADYIMLEFLRLGKTNLTYTVIPGCDHSLFEVVMVNGEEKPVSHRKEAFEMIGDWISTH